MSLGALRRVKIVDIESQVLEAEGEQGPSVEAQEAANQQLYEHALSLQSSGASAEAMAAYRELLDQQLIIDAEPQTGGGSPGEDPDHEQRPSLHLRFLALKNLSELEEAASELAPALERLLAALRIHQHDAVLWQRLGSLALRTGNRRLARLALEQAVDDTRGAARLPIDQDKGACGSPPAGRRLRTGRQQLVRSDRLWRLQQQWRDGFLDGAAACARRWIGGIGAVFDGKQ